jgi:hypothetical protein
MPKCALTLDPALQSRRLAHESQFGFPNPPVPLKDHTHVILANRENLVGHNGQAAAEHEPAALKSIPHFHGIRSQRWKRASTPLDR